MQKGLCMREKAETVGVKITRLNFLGFFGCGSTAYVSYMSLVHTAYICPIDNYPWIKTKQNETLSVKSV